MANQVAYGFVNLVDVFADRVSAIGVDVVSTAVQKTVDEHNRQIAAMLGLFVKTGVKAKTRFLTPTVARLQPMDQDGKARPIRTAGNYEVSFPIQMGGAAWGANFLSKAKMTVEEANTYTNALISADMRWMRDHVLAALFSNTDWTYSDPDDDIGSLTIHGLANSDAVTYIVQSGADSGATDTHYLGQAAAIADATNPYPTIYSELTEHPENSGQVIVFVPTANVATTIALAEFHPTPDPNIQIGANTDQVVGSLNATYPGTLLGYTDSKCWIVEWKSLPAQRLIAVTTDGEPPLGMRQDDEIELQGFRQTDASMKYPFWESQWMRRAGFGAWNRVGAVVMKISDASYDIPTGYESPMP